MSYGEPFAKVPWWGEFRIYIHVCVYIYPDVLSSEVVSHPRHPWQLFLVSKPGLTLCLIHWFLSPAQIFVQQRWVLMPANCQFDGPQIWCPMNLIIDAICLNGDLKIATSGWDFIPVHRRSCYAELHRMELWHQPHIYLCLFKGIASFCRHVYKCTPRWTHLIITYWCSHPTLAYLYIYIKGDNKSELRTILYFLWRFTLEA